jgi:tetratricopeptide (TPR) repeat protein
MSHAKARLMLCAAIGVALVCQDAEAEPSLWDAARNPAVFKAYRRLEKSKPPPAPSPLGLLAPRPTWTPQPRDIRDAILLLTTGRDEDVEPAIELTLTLVELVVKDDAPAYARGQRNSMLEITRQLLEHTIKRTSDPRLRAHLWLQLGIISAKLGNPNREFEAYAHVLDLEWMRGGRGLRGTAYYNRGDSALVVGRLDSAIADYRRALQESDGDVVVQTGAYWGLGIALERSGDLPSALEAMQAASKITIPNSSRRIVDFAEQVGLFYVPFYEIFYYRALTAMALARSARRLEEKKYHYERCVSEWTGYLREAQADNPAWIKNAALHRDSCTRELAKVNGELGKQPRRPAPRQRQEEPEPAPIFRWPPIPAP